MPENVVQSCKTLENFKLISSKEQALYTTKIIVFGCRDSKTVKQKDA